MTPTKRLLYLQNGSHAAAFEQLGNAMAFDPNNSKAVLAAGSVGMYYVLLAKPKREVVTQKHDLPFPHTSIESSKLNFTN